MGILSKRDYLSNGMAGPTLAATRRAPVSKRPDPYVEPASLDAACWCERAIVNVPTNLIRRAETLSCGRRECSR